MPHEIEGVIKFVLEYEKAEVVTPDMIEDLHGWRETLFNLKLIGQDPELYGGLSYGNISRRIAPERDEFVITGSQTSHLPSLTTEHYALVVKCYIADNRLVARGLIKPSSEALTHAAFYYANQSINYVFHVHNATIWKNATQLNIPMTASNVSYGTPEMAMEIKKMFESGVLNAQNVVAMGGHQDGVISFGITANEAGQSLKNVLSSIE